MQPLDRLVGAARVPVDGPTGQRLTSAASSPSQHQVAGPLTPRGMFPEVLRSLFLSSGGRFLCFRTGRAGKPFKKDGGRSSGDRLSARLLSGSTKNCTSGRPKAPGCFKRTPGSFERTPGSFQRTPGSLKGPRGPFKGPRGPFLSKDPGILKEPGVLLKTYKKPIKTYKKPLKNL